MSTAMIREAKSSDLEELREIYNDEVLHGVATFDTEPVDLENRRQWFENHRTSNHPLYVEERDGRVAGFVSLSTFVGRKAFDGTVELSLYIARDFRGRGIGREMMEFILDYARREDSIHTVVSVITSENEISIRLHREFGFEFRGRIREAGWKFHRYLDVDYYQLMV